jgi:predicted Zn-dependent protease
MPSPELDAADRHHLDAAEGWLGLGDWKSADDELTQISSAMRAHPDVLRARWDVYAKAKIWEGAAEVAKVFLERFPESPFGWLHTAYALHELKHTSEAREVLLKVEARFKEDWHIHYNLACYAAQLSKPEEAIEHLKRAVALNAQARGYALEDRDLEPVRAQIAKI